jgi:hypothetical protein
MPSIAPTWFTRAERSARSIERLVRDAFRPQRRTAAVPVRRAAVRNACRELLELAAALRAGMCDEKLAHWFIVDCDGPLYRGDADLRTVAGVMCNAQPWYGLVPAQARAE